ncbi:MAG TPA: enterotoxin [Terracidiphilus sp.]|jgi:hypothetical protein|nr:enterotoxin [Terracidiphilus sp.]
MRRTAVVLFISTCLLHLIEVRAFAQENANMASAVVQSSLNGYRLENGVISADLSLKDGKLAALTVTDRMRTASVPVPSPFELVFQDGSRCVAEKLAIDADVKVLKTSVDPRAARFADTLPGAEIAVDLTCPGHALQIAWTLQLRDGSSYLRQSVALHALDQDAPIRRVQMIDLPLAGAHVVGSVNGSPIVADNVFLGFEHPLSRSEVADGRAQAWIDRDLPLRAGQTITYSSVIGVTRSGQMRRDFLAYLERERAHPYRTFLHYNSWYDLGYFNPYDEAGALDRIHTFGHELTEKRGVQLDSFLFDDGWDNHKSLWQFNTGFPNGFTPIRKAAAEYHANPGIWMSPWGGYSKPKQERIAFGQSENFEIIHDGYALSGPKYYAAFRDVCLSMIRDYGVNQFKFDGTGNAGSVFPGSQFDSDFSAAIHLIGELRTAKPDIFINLTTGTWPSPFWLLYADSIWRGGDDDSTAGVGPYRERWITYRDAQTYQRVVKAGPLYPLNSLMLHGLIFAQHHKQLDQDPHNDFRNEIRSYFGTGTQLQEMYITPSLLTAANWDDLAEAAKWSRTNADVLKDTHWVGGDPAQLQAYGWASWSSRKGILVLRNPSDREQIITLKLQDVFELPGDAAQVYHAQSPWKDDAGRPAIVLQANEAHQFHLAPFAVLTLDLLPDKSAH